MTPKHSFSTCGIAWIAQAVVNWLYKLHRVRIDMSQQDFFKAPQQSDMFAGEKRQESYAADPQRVRERLHQIIAEARAAEVLPWDKQKLGYYRTVVPQMSVWLPDDEAAQLRFEFATELRRLEPASAA
jgi:hypothetical protein